MSDASARVDALDVGRHVLLQAPAGSGKTTVLAQRFLRALAVVDEPEEVLAITFTRKAAAEMRERVLQALEGDLPAAHPDLATWSNACADVRAQAARRGWQMVELPQRLRIQTIDSLAHEVARTMPLLGRMQTNLAVTDHADALYQSAARLTWREAQTDASLRADGELLLRRLDNNLDEARQMLAALLPWRNRWLPWLVDHPDDALADRVAQSIGRIVKAELAQALSLMPSAWWNEGGALAAAAASNRLGAGDAKPGGWRVWLGADAQVSDSPATLECWRGIADLLLTASGARPPRSTVNKTNGFPPTDKPLKERWQAWMQQAADEPRVFDVLRDICDLPEPDLDAEERAALAALARIMVRAAAELKLVFRERGLVDHGEIAAIARQALLGSEGLGEDTLRHTLRITHLLVDEFQDTSPEQLELVSALTRGWQPGDGRSLFFVGDPMQSIYLFRNSEVGLFLQVRAAGVGDIALEAMQLTRNFRSQQQLVEWSNRAFSRIFPAHENLRRSAVTFLAGEAARPPDARVPAEVLTWPRAEPDAQVEARDIAAEIASLRAEQPDLRIAVLVQTRTLAAPVLRALRDAGIPVLGVDLATLSERPVVRDLVALGQALLDCLDRTAWLAVLRAPYCGLSLADLLQVAEAAGNVPLTEVLQDPGSIVGLSDDAAQRLRRAAPLLLDAWRARGSMDVASLIEDSWIALGGATACRDMAELSHARQYLLALRNLQQREGQVSPGALAELAARLLDRGESLGHNPVEVLTIHRAKGLEWDVVFVPGLGRKARNDSTPLLRALELPEPAGGSDLLLAVRSLGRPNASDPLARYIRKLEAERLQNERRRLLYVAATRAKLRLYLSGHASFDNEGRARAPAGSLLQHLWPIVADSFNQLEAPQAVQVVQATPLAMSWRPLPADFQLRQELSLPQVQSLVRAQAESVGELEFDWVGPLARAAGTVMHAELERLARFGEPAVAELALRVNACAAGLCELGIAAEVATSTAQQIVQRLAAMAQEETARWLLFAPHREASCELRLSGIIEGQLRNAVMDRSFVDGHGTRWVVDYKTGEHRGGGLEEFVAREMDRYARQLQLYCALARGLGPEPVRAGLYFPWLGVFREFEDAT